MKDPIDRIEWLTAGELRANHYNPNVVLNAELKLLEFSILNTGWLQPILVNTGRVIIDGFHRWSLAKSSKALMAKYAGLVPCAVLDIPDWQAMLMTVRINRAKGTHLAFRMADLVKAVVNDHAVAEDIVAAEIGATPAEVRLLLTPDVFARKDIQSHEYSKAWEPGPKKAAK